MARRPERRSMMAMFGKGARSAAKPEPATGTATPQGAINARAAARQRLLLAGIAGIALVGGCAYIFAGGASKPGADDPAKPLQVHISTDDIVNKPASEKQWMAQSENQISDQNMRLKAVEGQVPQVAAMREQISTLQQDNSKIKSDATKLFQIYQQENSQQRAQIEAMKAAGTAARPVGAPGGVVGNDPFRVSGSGQPAYGSAGGYDAQGRPIAGPAGGFGGGAEVKTISFGAASGTGAQGGGGGGKNPVGFDGVRPDAPPTVIEDSPEYLPPNSYAPAKVIVGVDASAGVSSQTDPLPVVLRITGPARSVLNNGKVLTTRIEGCVVNGAARGDLSAEKVYVKLAKMTCDQPGGRVAVTEVKGFISFGGKTGVRGRVVTREGGLIGQAFLAGIAGGFGRGFSANANALFQGTTTNVNGERQQLSPGEIVQAGLGQGVATASDMISKYLIERAEQYQPVIEMPTGVDVEIVFLDGVYVRSSQ